MSYFYIIFGLLFAGTLIFIGYSLYKEPLNKIKKDNSKFIENKEHIFGSKTNKGILYLFYTNWCPHCKDTITTWDTISEKYKNYNIHFTKLDCDYKKNKRIVNNFEIKEYPTIIFVYKEKKYYFDANLEEEVLNKFLSYVYKENKK